jgi:RNA polymerase sigma-70 factor (ECF subfamily)
MRRRRDVTFSKMEGGADEYMADAIPDTEPLPDEVFERKETAGIVNRAVQDLSLDAKTVVLLHHADGLTFEEIAQVVGKSMNTVKSQYRRALMSLRKSLSGGPLAPKGHLDS